MTGEQHTDEQAILKLTISVDNLTETMKEFKEDFKQFRAVDIKDIHNDIQSLKDWRTQQTGIINFLKLAWYFIGAIVVAYLIYLMGWKK